MGLRRVNLRPRALGEVGFPIIIPHFTPLLALAGRLKAFMRTVKYLRGPARALAPSAFRATLGGLIGGVWDGFRLWLYCRPRVPAYCTERKTHPVKWSDFCHTGLRMVEG